MINVSSFKLVTENHLCKTIPKKLPLSSKTGLEDLHNWHLLYIYSIKYITDHTNTMASF